MDYDIVEINMTPNLSSEAFEEAITDSQLNFMASALEGVGYEPVMELNLALERAMKICSCCGLPVKEHFKTVYIADEKNHTVRKDCKLSRLGYSLVMLNGDADNPIVGHTQLEMIRNVINSMQ